MLLNHPGAGAGPSLGGCLELQAWCQSSHLLSFTPHGKLLHFVHLSIFIFLYLSTFIIYFRLFYLAIISVWLGLSSLPISSLVAFDNKPTQCGLQAGIAAAQALQPAWSNLSPSTSCESLNPKTKSLPFKPFAFQICECINSRLHICKPAGQHWAWEICFS